MALCACGCGQPTGIAKQTDPRRGWIKGQPVKYVRGHHARGRPRPELHDKPNPGVSAANRARKGRRYNKPPQWIEEDRGYRTHCWIWQLMVNPQGYAYGRMRGNREMGRMHKKLYERLFGPVPEGMHLHHECEQVACVNPMHLRLVTAAEHRVLHPH